MSDAFFDKKFQSPESGFDSLTKGQYESCTFTGIDFSDKNLSGFTFADCDFRDCNLSMAKLGNAALKDVRFFNCKMLGLHFEDADDFLFSVRFDQCNLNHTSFFKRKLKKTSFQKCSLQEVDFTQADLTESSFPDCDLSGALFEESNLEKADFSAAFNYTIDPEKNRLKKAVFSREGLAGLLTQYGIVIR